MVGLRRLALETGVAVIKMHEAGRHAGASLMRGADVSNDVRMKAVGHVTESVYDRHTHVKAAAHGAAAEQVAALLARAGKP